MRVELMLVIFAVWPFINPSCDVRVELMFVIFAVWPFNIPSCDAKVLFVEATNEDNPLAFTFINPSCDAKVLFVEVINEEILFLFWAICEVCKANSTTEAESIPPTVPVKVGALTGVLCHPLLIVELNHLVVIVI